MTYNFILLTDISVEVQYSSLKFYLIFGKEHGNWEKDGRDHFNLRSFYSFCEIKNTIFFFCEMIPIRNGTLKLLTVIVTAADYAVDGNMCSCVSVYDAGK
jgi:hypothetical protein